MLNVYIVIVFFSFVHAKLLCISCTVCTIPSMEVRQRTHVILKEFVSDKSVSDMYASLAQFGPQTISELSRSSKVERTRVYRNLQELQKLQLVEIELQPHRQIIHASSLSNLQHEVISKKAALDSIATLIDQLQVDLENNVKTDVSTRVQFYRGQAGIEQMLWNQTKAKSEINSILSENLQSHTKREFFERWVERCNERKIRSRSLVDDNFIAAQKRWYDGKFNHSLALWSARKMPANISSIPHRTTVYDDVTTYFSWQEDDLFGIEIHNKNIADNQRQYFELLWKKCRAVVVK